MDYAGEPPLEEQMSTQKEHHRRPSAEAEVKPNVLHIAIHKFREFN